MQSKKIFARQLRGNMTEAEVKLWFHIRQKQLKPFSFRRQFVIGSYIVDFVCFKAKLIVECDGGQHCDSASDAVRDAYLRQRGFKVIRFWNHEIFNNIEGVLIRIWSELNNSTKFF